MGQRCGMLFQRILLDHKTQEGAGSLSPLERIGEEGTIAFESARMSFLST